MYNTNKGFRFIPSTVTGMNQMKFCKSIFVLFECDKKCIRKGNIQEQDSNGSGFILTWKQGPHSNDFALDTDLDFRS